MKKKLIFLGIAAALLTCTSCKKWYNCTCYYPNGAVLWQGLIEGTSKANAQNHLANGDCMGYNVSCN